MKRRTPTSDLRPDWRDQAMPVLVCTKSEGLVSWKPERFSKAVAGRLQICTEPTWRNDPTYDMKRKPK
jgi:hypothetical protein